MNLWRRKPRRHLASEAISGLRPGGGEKGGSLVRGLTIIAAIATIVGTVFAVRNGCGGSGEANLMAVRSTVVNRPPEYMNAAGVLRQKPETEPTIEAEIRNTGNATGWVERALVTVEDVTDLPECLTQGGSGESPRTKRYRITLPEYPGVGKRVRSHDLHVEVGPGNAVIARLAFQVRDFGVQDLFALHVRLLAAPSGRSLNLGRFVIGVPGPPSRSGLLFPETEGLLEKEEALQSRLVSSWCYRRNVASAHRLTARPGKRSADIKALAHLYLAPIWSSWADKRPPRSAIAPLFHSGDVEGPLLAVFAAKQTGDADLSAAVRRRAAATFLQQARESMDEWARGALGDLERSISLRDTSAARTLMREAEVKARVEEEQEEGTA